MLPAAAYSRRVGPMIAAISIVLVSAYCVTVAFWALSTSLLRGTGAAAGIALINAIGNLGGFCGLTFWASFVDRQGTSKVDCSYCQP